MNSWTETLKKEKERTQLTVQVDQSGHEKIDKLLCMRTEAEYFKSSGDAEKRV